MSNVNPNLMNLALEKKNTARPPVWFMRQAGRYHQHYQNLKKQHTFIELCRNPDLATEVTFGPIDDFDFDAAILFSDLLFPLEALGTGLRYDPGPKLDWHLKDLSDLNRLNPDRLPISALLERLRFQGVALRKIRTRLSPTKALLGFVGGPFTLFAYAVEGSHQGDLAPTKSGLKNGLFAGFLRHLEPLLVENMVLQAESGADVVAMMDTCAGDLDPETYSNFVIPSLRAILVEFKRRCPQTPVLYYSKKTDRRHWLKLADLPISALGVDWRTPMADVINEFHDRYALQGNFSPEAITAPTAEFTKELELFFEPLMRLPRQKLSGWICGLGHGILQTTPESHVRHFLKRQKEIFS